MGATLLAVEADPAAGGHQVTKQFDVSFDPSAGNADEAMTGVMVALGLSPEVAATLAYSEADAPEGVAVEPIEALHVTLAFMGDVSAWPTEQVEQLAAVLRSFAVYEWPLEGAITGWAIFTLDDGTPEQPAQGAAVALLDVPYLSEWRSRLAQMLRDSGLYPVDNHDFTAHVTLAYGPVEALRTLPVAPVIGVFFDSLMLVAGTDVWRMPFDGPRLAATWDNSMPVILAADERRFSFSPLYVPDKEDSHGEWANADDLQAMVWDWMRAGHRGVSLQHLPGTVAGEAVEIVCWPWELTATMTLGDGSEPTEVTLPAGTVYQGVVWEPWAWQALKSKKLNGLSMGGLAWRVDEEPGEDED